MKLTRTQLDQLMAYCKMMEIEGYYYGNKAQWNARHEQIKKWITEQLEKAK